MTKKSKVFWISNFILAFIFVSVVAFAWNNPPANPPSGSGAIATDANNNIGVGESAPSARLSIKTGAAVAGSGTVSSSGTTVTGSGTSFMTQIKVGDSIIASGQTRVVTAIASDTSLTTNSSFSPALGGGTAYSYQRAISNFNDGSTDQLRVFASGQVGLNITPGSATKLGINTTGFGFPLYITTTDGTSRAFGINFSSAATDVISVGATSAHRLKLTTSNAFRLSINSGGQIGIGVTDAILDASSARLTVIDPNFGSLPAAAPTILFLGSSDGTTGGSSIRARGTASYQIPDLTEYVRVKGSIADYEPGDILEIDLKASDLFKKSEKSYGKNLAGVVSKTGSVILGEEGVEFDPNGKPKHHVQMALAGRLPIKVIAPVAIGDAITSSEIPGVGMRAVRSGRVLGFALEPYGEGGIGYVKIFINPHYWVAE
jgi:hypothetical protein